MEEDIKKVFRSIIIVSCVALVSITIVCSVALTSMCIQSNTALEENTEFFRLYMTSDYDYGEITQSTDVKVGE
jgi:hypothetical protein